MGMQEVFTLNRRVPSDSSYHKYIGMYIGIDSHTLAIR